MDGSARETWNARYRERGEDDGPPTPPSDWLVENQALIGGTRALDLACGTGRMTWNANHCPPAPTTSC
jgi:hypothetical protein